MKHVISFKLKDEVPEVEKPVVMSGFKEATEALPAKISVVHKVEVGLNMSPEEAWHIVPYSEFNTPENVKFYAAHPDHMAAEKVIAETEDSHVCVDYEL